MSPILLLISSCVIPFNVPLRYIFSIPVYSGLKPAPNSNNADILPLTDTFPKVGFNTPVIIFNKVDLPLPFFPIIPTISPFLILKFTLFNASNFLYCGFAKGKSPSIILLLLLSYNLYVFVKSVTSIAYSDILFLFLQHIRKLWS